MINWDDYTNFSKSEFTCHCECKQTHMNEAFIFRLQLIRNEYGRPIHITSGYRCPLHNDKVSSTGLSGPHTTGRAVDVGVALGDAFDLTAIAFLAGIRGFGFNQKGPHKKRFIHLDDLEIPPRPRIWTY